MRCWLRQDINKQLCFSFSLGKGVGKETASIWKLQSVILAYNVHYTLNAAYAQIICIYTNLLVNAIVRLSHPQSGYSQGQETFLAPSADKQTCNYDTEYSNHHPSLSALRSGSSFSTLVLQDLHLIWAVLMSSQIAKQLLSTDWSNICI